MIDVIFPVLDEAEALPWVLSRVPEGYRPIVVDNGSSDGSAVVASRLGAEVITEPQQGFGAACWAGLQAARSEVIAFCDADASFDPRDLPLVVDPIVSGEFDLLLGARIVAERGVWPAHARLANRYLARRMRRLTGAALSDLGPMRAMRREALLELALADRRSGWPLEMVLKAGLAGWRIGEVCIPYHPRIGRSKVTGTVMGTVRATRDMGAILATYR